MNALHEYLPLIFLIPAVALACYCAYRLGHAEGITEGIESAQEEATRRAVARNIQRK